MAAVRCLKEVVMRLGSPKHFPLTMPEQRLIAQATRLVSGDYVIPRNETWFYDLRREFLAFPNGNYDDQVDSISQFIAWLHTPRGRGLLNRNPVTGRRRRVSRQSRPSRR